MSNGVELTAHDALVGEILGELVIVRKSVDEFRSELPLLVGQLKDAGELVTHRFESQCRHIIDELDERAKTMHAAANEFRDARELLIAEVATKTTAHFEDVLKATAERLVSARRMELTVAALVGSGATIVVMLLALHLVSSL